MTTIPPCAARCGLVDILIHEIARARGTDPAVVRVTHGLDGPWSDEHAPDAQEHQDGHSEPAERQEP